MPDIYVVIYPKNIKIKIHRAIILSVVFYGCETWSLTFREERRLRMSENRALRRILASKRDEVTGEWRKLHNVELSELFSPIIIRVIKSRRMRWAGYIACMGKRRGLCRVSVGKTGGKETTWKTPVEMGESRMGVTD